MINPQKPVINPIKNVNRFTALIYIYIFDISAKQALTCTAVLTVIITDVKKLTDPKETTSKRTVYDSLQFEIV